MPKEKSWVYTTTKNVRHVPNLKMNLISGTLADEGYDNSFAKFTW